MGISVEVAVKFQAKAIEARSLDELVGLCKGVVADGQINGPEAEFILNWLNANQSVANTFPANVLYPRLVEMLADGKLDDDEARELLGFLRQMTGDTGQMGAVNQSTSIAFDAPLPDLAFLGQTFCFTGEFGYGRRDDVKARTAALGARVASSVTLKGCILVVGCIGSEAWLHSTHGRKIEAAVAARAKGKPVSVVPEEHWHVLATRREQVLEGQDPKTNSAPDSVRKIIFQLVRG